MFIRLFFLFALIVGCNKGTDDSSVKVINGENVTGTTALDQKILASTVSFYANDRSFCTGTLIGEGLVLSAAHCFQRPRPRVFVSFGKESGTGEMRAVKKPIFHADYNSNMTDSLGMNYDIAVVSFEGKNPPNTKFVQIASDSLQPKDVLIAGYGFSDTTRGEAVGLGIGTLRQKTLQVLQYGKGEMLFSRGGACSGDSGGPGFFYNGADLVVAGITSRGIGGVTYRSEPGLCEKAEGVVYTDARAFRNWIARAAVAAGAQPPEYLLPELKKQPNSGSQEIASTPPNTDQGNENLVSCDEIQKLSGTAAVNGIQLRSLYGIFIAQPSATARAKFCFKVIATANGGAVYHSKVMSKQGLEANDDNGIPLSLSKIRCTDNQSCVVLQSTDQNIKIFFGYDATEKRYKSFRLDYFGVSISSSDIIDYARASDQTNMMN